jgi:hypothetical protein
MRELLKLASSCPVFVVVSGKEENKERNKREKTARVDGREGERGVAISVVVGRVTADSERTCSNPQCDKNSEKRR